MTLASSTPRPYNLSLSLSFFLFLSFPAKQSGPRSEWFVFRDGMFAFCAPHPILFHPMPRLAVHVDADADRASVLWGEKKNEENMKIWRKEELQEKQNRQMGKKERRPDAGERTA